MEVREHEAVAEAVFGLGEARQVDGVVTVRSWLMIHMSLLSRGVVAVWPRTEPGTQLKTIKNRWKVNMASHQNPYGALALGARGLAIATGSSPP